MGWRAEVTGIHKLPLKAGTHLRDHLFQSFVLLKILMSKVMEPVSEEAHTKIQICRF